MNTPNPFVALVSGMGKAMPPLESGHTEGGDGSGSGFHVPFDSDSAATATCGSCGATKAAGQRNCRFRRFPQSSIRARETRSRHRHGSTVRWRPNTCMGILRRSGGQRGN